MAIRLRQRFAIAYSEDLRVRALDLIGNGVSITQVSRLLKISRPTLYRWKQQLEEIGSTAPNKSVPPAQPSLIRDWDKFQEFTAVPAVLRYNK
jgi:transposase